MVRRSLRIIAFFTFVTLLSGCGRMVSESLLGPTMTNLSHQTDINLVCEGSPTFLLMLDSMLIDSPGDQKLLLHATKSFGGYAAALEVCGKPQRAATVSIKAKRYAMSLLWNCDALKRDCSVSLSQLKQTLADLDRTDVERLFWAGNGWATWVRYQAGSPQSLVQLPHIEQIMLRVLELDETYYHGGAHIFLGTYYGSKPPLLGGKPELSRHHFERALTLSNRQFLPALVLYAQTYARMAFDRELFVSLLQEVLDFPLESQPASGLANQVAKRKAGSLLDEVDQFF